VLNAVGAEGGFDDAGFTAGPLTFQKGVGVRVVDGTDGASDDIDIVGRAGGEGEARIRGRRGQFTRTAFGEIVTAPEGFGLGGGLRFEAIGISPAEGWRDGNGSPKHGRKRNGFAKRGSLAPHGIVGHQLGMVRIHRGLGLSVGGDCEREAAEYETEHEVLGGECHRAYFH